MSDQDIITNKYSELRSIYKYYIDSYIALYQLKTENEEELYSIYKMIKTDMIDSMKHSPYSIIRSILKVIPYNNRYEKSYLYLAKLITDDYHVEEVNSLEFYIEYGIEFYNDGYFREISSENLDILSENTIYRAIMYDDKEVFISFIEKEEFNEDQKLNSSLYPYSPHEYSLLELCCYHGAIDCFKLLRTKFNSEITQTCLQFSFLGRNQEIMSECLKYRKPDEECMTYAIISHNIDFVTFLMYEYFLDINLHNCVEYNNLDSILVYFDQSNDFNSCLIYSAMINIPSLCEYFLSLGANINEKDSNELTALHYAARYNFKESAKLLISHGANVNDKNQSGDTALHYAAYHNSKEIAELLISHGANINDKNQSGDTALHYAAYHNSKEIAELLISHGAKINEKDNDGNTALHIAAFRNSKETAELLISHGANINDKGQDGFTALHFSAYNNSTEIAELLISHGANINEKNQNGFTAFHYAAILYHTEIAELLLLHGANINEKINKYGCTALHIVADYNSHKVAENLISLRQNINKTDKERDALHYELENSRKDIVEFLLLHGANANEKDGTGKTALHVAVKYNEKETVELLLSHGANINEKDGAGKTAIQYAEDKNNKEIVELLISHGTNNNFPT
ncbi:ankyrin repeat protein, putative [Trichomonas vaginalis G3]|uniref:Ankyrin repeat protein, putative n=1 Tax=Trichomonas vaginalis (strain ATCC PRA-98 / G3) TaxID=412133 RepID=A2DIV6_TRIV3|nr:ankyrin repeat and SOCS box-containing protein 4 family [Trichomonas vaginalis G3]EAY19719.1 ankyrin repeat protein, putative [Trichomonas vaginalis G3]KAI5521261.1 ankyrin repeat and SOCS box-containing protein 4 family [Trichomonas vaginalis G3]|eukprot:XP_001580705.1 ankyrin repeat protein [Trichomonas vaginalis G3]